MSKKRIIYLEVLRAIATIAVIIIHVTAQNWRVIDVSSIEWIVMTLWNSAARIAVPLFVMISGVVFLNREKDITIQEIFKKYSLRILIVFCAWSFIYAVVYSFTYGESIIKFILRFVGGHYHLWYLLMLIGLYLIIPFLRKITADKKTTEYFLLLSFILTSLIPTLIKLPILKNFSDPYGSLHYHFTLGYSSYFVLGFYLHKYGFEYIQRKWIYLLGILGFLFTFISTVGLSIQKQSVYAGFLNNFMIGVVLETIAVFMLCKDVKIHSKKVLTCINMVSKYSFGIYLVHILVLDKLECLGLNTLSFSIYLSIPVLIIIVFFISMFISYLLNCIPFIKKYFV